MQRHAAQGDRSWKALGELFSRDAGINKNLVSLSADEVKSTSAIEAEGNTRMRQPQFSRELPHSHRMKPRALSICSPTTTMHLSTPADRTLRAASQFIGEMEVSVRRFQSEAAMAPLGGVEARKLNRLALEGKSAITSAEGLIKTIIRDECRLAALEQSAFNPGQPRIPAGSSGGGQWTSGDGSSATPVATPIMGSRTKDRPELIRQQIVEAALAQVDSQAWSDEAAKGNYPSDTNKCNLFVYDMLTQADASPGLPNGFLHGYPPTAGQWADPDFNIPGWTMLSPDESPEPGDVAAQAINYSDATGHVMIVGPDNTLIGTGEHGNGPAWDYRMDPDDEKFRVTRGEGLGSNKVPAVERMIREHWLKARLIALCSALPLCAPSICHAFPKDTDDYNYIQYVDNIHIIEQYEYKYKSIYHVSNETEFREFLTKDYNKIEDCLQFLAKIGSTDNQRTIAIMSMSQLDTTKRLIFVEGMIRLLDDGKIRSWELVDALSPPPNLSGGLALHYRDARVVKLLAKLMQKAEIDSWSRDRISRIISGDAVFDLAYAWQLLARNGQLSINYADLFLAAWLIVSGYLVRFEIVALLTTAALTAALLTLHRWRKAFNP